MYLVASVVQPSIVTAVVSGFVHVPSILATAISLVTVRFRFSAASHAESEV